jgi:putative peptidoglycan lipid II flippase
MCYDGAGDDMSKFLIRTAGVLAILTLVGRMIGFIRNILLTGQFGAGVETDAYLVAFTIPGMLFLVIPGVINAVVVPPLKGAIVHGDLEGRRRIFIKTLSVVTLLFGIITIFGIVGADGFVHFLAPGFHGYKHDLTVQLTQEMFPSVFFIGLSSLFQGVLSAHNQFKLPPIGNIVNGAIVIGTIAWVAPHFGVASVAWSVTLGYVIYTCMQVPAILKLDYRFQFTTRFTNDPVFRSMGARFVPILLGLTISQMYTILEKIFVSTLGDAKLTALGLASTIFQLPLGVFSAALVLPLYPIMAEQVKRLEFSSLANTARQGFLVQFHLLLPISVALSTMPGLFVKLFYDHGSKFSDSDVHLTAWALLFISTGMVGWIGRDLMTRVFYALEDTRTPVTTATIGFVLYAGFAWYFFPILDHAALAFSYALSSTINFIMLAFLISRRVKNIYNRTFLQSVLRGIASVALMSGALYVARPYVQMASVYIQVASLVTIGVLVYGISLFVMKEPLLRSTLDKVFILVRRRLIKK